MKIPRKSSAYSGEDVIVPFTVYGAAPVSSFALISKDNVMRVPDNLPQEALCAPTLQGSVPTPQTEYASRLRDARNIIGLEPSRGPWPLTLNTWLRLLPTNRGVPKHWLLRGMGIVGPQRDDFSCGINSAARFGAMLGQAECDFHQWIPRGPTYSFAGRTIGGNPEMIQDLLRSKPCLQGSSVSQLCTTTFCRQLAIIERACDQGRPIMVLLYYGQFSMHWVNIVGRRNNDYVILDTNGALYVVEGGVDGLKHMMNCDNGMAQRLGFVERFNSISCTEACATKDWPLIDFDSDYYEKMYPDVKSCVDGHLQLWYYSTLNPAQWRTVRHQLLAEHFLNYGLNEGRKGSPNICFLSYKQRYDLPGSLEDAALHYYQHGVMHGFSAVPLSRS